MSYILDALKRADAERSRGAVPDLHARPFPSSGSATPPPMRNRVWLFTVTAAALVALAAGLWTWRTTTGLPGMAAPVAAAPASVATPMPLASPQRMPATPASAMQPALAPKAQLASPKAAARATPVPLLSQLPEALQRQIPKITITGTVYSDNPKQRLLLVNNQVLPQGSAVAPELTLEEIRPRSAVFNFKGTRFQISR